MDRILTRIIPLLVLLGINGITYSQSLSLVGGLNLSQVNFEGAVGNSKTGYHFGGLVDFPVDESFSIETGIFFDTKGWRYATSQSGVSPINQDSVILFETNNTIKQVLHYLDLSLRLAWDHQLGSLKMSASFGGYFGFGLSGHHKESLAYDGQLGLMGEVGNQRKVISYHELSEKQLADLLAPYALEAYNEDRSIRWGSSSSDDFKWLDYGLSFAVGGVYRSVLLMVSYDYGIAQVSSITKAQHRLFRVSIGFQFWQSTD